MTAKSGKALAGLAVLNTRPRGQSAALSALLRAAGAEVLELPLLKIVASDAAQTAPALAEAKRADFIIFTSANAAALGAVTLPRPANTRIYALGPATAAALAERGLGDCLALDGGGSEELLEAPGLQALQGQHGLIFTGEGGRELLATALTARGAELTVARVYRREAEAHAPAAVDTALAAAQVLVITSGEGLTVLLALTPPETRADLLAKPLLLPSARVADAAMAAGFCGPLLLPAAMSDAALLARLLAWRREGA